VTQPLIDQKKISFHNYDDTRHRGFIDHVVITKSMKDQIEKVQVMDDLPLARVASDHFPVMVTIKTK
jgi:endonuclease/exonuclease/phosphatase family metal-dependent hydrolase